MCTVIKLVYKIFTAFLNHTADTNEQVRKKQMRETNKVQNSNLL